MSAFDEWFSSKFELVNKVVTDNEHHPATTFKRNMGFSFEAGAQSRQAEIDELQKEIDSYKCIYGKLELERDGFRKQIIDQGQRFNDQQQRLKDLEFRNDELRKRIDEIKKHIENEKWFDEYGDYHCSVIEIIEIIKGTTNEQ